MINDGQWHHICVTWTTRDGVWEAYQDGTQGGNGENLAPYHPIKPQGVLVLGQEQVGASGLGRRGMLVGGGAPEPEEGQPGWPNGDEGEKEGVGQRGTWFPPFPERAKGNKVCSGLGQVPALGGLLRQYKRGGPCLHALGAAPLSLARKGRSAFSDA